MRASQVLAAAAVILVSCGIAFGVWLERGENPAFTAPQVEAAFDGVGLDVEPDSLGVFLDPTGDDAFSVVVLDDADEAERSYDILARQRQETRAHGLPGTGFVLQRANVLVSSDRDVRGDTLRKIANALELLGKSADEAT